MSVTLPTWVVVLPMLLAACAVSFIVVDVLTDLLLMPLVARWLFRGLELTRQEQLQMLENSQPIGRFAPGIVRRLLHRIPLDGRGR